MDKKFFTFLHHNLIKLFEISCRIKTIAFLEFNSRKMKHNIWEQNR